MAYFDCIVGGSGKGNTLVVTCADDLAGATITCTNGTKTYTKTCPSTAPYEVTFYGLEAGTWTVSAAVSGNTYTTTVVVVDCAALLGGFNWRTWVDTARFLDSTDYNSLDEVLADELAVRELCLEHNCVDYLADIATANEDVETIINNDLFAKWVNNSDYSLDILGANVVIKALMDEADKYFYGEWALMPQVPTMTSNTAPYGTASASSVYSTDYAAYGAFTGRTIYGWIPSTSSLSEYVQYQFLTATKISKVWVGWSPYTSSQTSGKETVVKIVASNDGSTWEDFTDNITLNLSDKKEAIVDAIKTTSFAYYRMAFVSRGSSTAYNDGTGFKLQFYAWAPKGNVPVMTSNTAPYGNAFASNTESATYDNYKAFDGNLTTNWSAGGGGTPRSTNQYVGYSFTNPICAKRFLIAAANPQSATDTRVKNFRIEASNDGFVSQTVTLYTGLYDYNDIYEIIDIDNNNYYLSYRCYVVDNYSPYTIAVTELQFYGRELSVSVPTMTSDTTPFGEVSYSGIWSSSFIGWQAFNPDSNYWISGQSGSEHYIAYEFLTPMVVKMLRYATPSAGDANRLFDNIALKGSNDGTNWEEIYSNNTQATVNTTYVTSIANSKAYKYLGLFINKSVSSTTAVALDNIQFYGEDYSEKEFEEGTTKKWLYDHGVELDDLTLNDITQSNYTNVAAIKEPSDIKCYAGSGNYISSVSKTDAIDLTDYSRVGIIIDPLTVLSNIIIAASTVKNENTSPTAGTQITEVKNAYYFDVQSINQSLYIFNRAKGQTSSGAMAQGYLLKEWWLE